MKISLTNNEYELSKFIFVNYIERNSQYKLIKNKQISQISNSLINILSDYDYLVFEEDNPPIELEAFLRSSIEFLLDKGVTKENISTLRKELEIVMKNLGCPRIKEDQDEKRQPAASSENQQLDNKKNAQVEGEKDFKILEELGRNSLAGRRTFKAKDNQTGEIVVIKKFQFLSNNWDGYKLIEKEIETLSNLDHPNIPKYLGQYEDEQGFCLVQEYIDAPSLASFGQLPIAEVTDIALSVLDILVYLQELSPPVFHRDIKPENILYNRETKQVYLVDFGVAKTGTGTTTSSTINGGTFGFMPPEQLLGQKLNQSSDLYSLGHTLICLLGGISSAEINQFINHRFEVDFSKTIPSDINWKFRDYLRELVSPDQSKRFVNAQTAKKALWYLRNVEYSLFVSNNPQKSNKSFFSEFLFRKRTYLYVSISLVVFLTGGFLIVSSKDAINFGITWLEKYDNLDSVGLLGLKEIFKTVFNSIFIMSFFLCICSTLRQTYEDGEFNPRNLQILVLLGIFYSSFQVIIELIFSNI